MSEKLVVKSGEAKLSPYGEGFRPANRAASLRVELLLGVKKDKPEAEYTFAKADEEFNKSQAANGIVSVNLTPADTDQPEATYVGELKCAWSGPVIKKSEDFFLHIMRAVTP